LDEILARSTALPVQFATNGMHVRMGHIIVASPDTHLFLTDDHTALVQGPHENRARPAIDPLFRSAAVHRRTRVIGAILSGLLDDGAAGLLAIKRCGGVAFVQHPDDAAEPSMPSRAAEVLGPLLDGAYPSESLGRHIVHLVGTKASAEGELPPEILLEAELSERPQTEHLPAAELGTLVALTCPGCGGPLREIDVKESLRYRCFTGHAYTARALLEDQSERVERALWAAVRSMEERAATLLALCRNSRVKDQERAARSFELDANEMRAHAEVVRNILLQHYHPPETAGLIR
jgi:two-component system chemotaxis response regulator CheB